MAEDGKIPPYYPMMETPSISSLQRTLWNAAHTDATLVLLRGHPRHGTKATIQFARRFGKPLCVSNPLRTDDQLITIHWLLRNKVRNLNVAGPRASDDKKIYLIAYRFLEAVFSVG